MPQNIMLAVIGWTILNFASHGPAVDACCSVYDTGAGLACYITVGLKHFVTATASCIKEPTRVQGYTPRCSQCLEFSAADLEISATYLKSFIW